ncbi:MAG: methyltransferase domain-containing protein [Dehalococcoidia bacterium]|jgi:ubiquinone/menaquinone biosynthesis C-methylase UbiE|nr:methyltransferase domain-containing protein [Dehalococcoidia bacterium]
MAGNDPMQRERYAHGYSEPMVRVMASRTADIYAKFLLPYLTPGMRLLDCGCGPGSITVGLARAVSPGETIGIDVEQSQADAATDAAKREGIGNARFQVASIYDLPFDDDSFDVAFMHAVLEHLDRPVDGLAEVLRVLKPGGQAGISHSDFGVDVVTPPSPFLQMIRTRTTDHWLSEGMDPYIGRHQQALMRRAGFTALETTVTDNGQGMAMGDDAPRMLRDHRDLFVHAGMLSSAEADDDALITGYIEEMEEWRKDPDRTYIFSLGCQTVGSKPG